MWRFAVIFAIALLLAVPARTEMSTLALSQLAFYVIHHSNNSSRAEAVLKGAQAHFSKRGWPDWIGVWVHDDGHSVTVVINDAYNVSLYTETNFLSEKDYLDLHAALSPLAGSGFLLLVIPRDHVYYDRYVTPAQRVIWRTN